MEYVEYIEIKNRMCDCVCEDCPLCRTNNGFYLDCDIFEQHYPKDAELLVAKWNKEHPQKTILGNKSIDLNIIK